jgi:hypothetical protein
MHPGETNAGTLNRGGHWTNEFKTCVCGHSMNLHVMNLNKHGGCVAFEKDGYCPCKKFEEAGTEER